MNVIDIDSAFFLAHPDRRAHIRVPLRFPQRDRQRSVRIVDESEGEFWSLGPHDKFRRRIILWRVPEDNPWFQKLRQPILKIPFLAFGDETIEDRDDILLPMIQELMTEEALRAS